MPQMITPYGMQGGQGRKSKAQSEWEKKLAQARMAMSLDGETALGLALGKGLRYLWDKHIEARHAKQNAKNQQDNETKSGQISDWDAFRKANGNPVIHDLVWPEAGADSAAPGAGVAWEKYVQANGLHGSRDYRQEAVERIMPTPQLNTGALTTDDLAAVLKDNPWRLNGQTPVFF